MNKFTIDHILPMFNVLYKNVPSLYMPIYNLYKTIYESDKIKFLKKNIKSGDKILDIGANIGFYTQIMSKLVDKSGKVYSFEPDPKNFKLLKKQCGKNMNVKLYQCAVGDKNKHLKLYISDSRNTDHQTYDIGDSRPYKKVKCIKIDSLTDDMSKLKLIKLDVQGYDYFALKGMEKTIKKTQGLIIFGEIWPYGLSKSGTSPKMYLTLLKKLGFRLKSKTINERVLNSHLEDKYFYTDFIATKP